MNKGDIIECGPDVREVVGVEYSQNSPNAIIRTIDKEGRHEANLEKTLIEWGYKIKTMNNSNQAGFIGALMIFISAAIFLWAVIFLPIFGWHYNTGDGSQVGYISAVERNGIFFKTYTAFVKPTLESTQEDDYCVVDPLVIAELQKASEQKLNVKVEYFSWLSSGVANCNAEGAVISKVSVIK